MQSTWGKCACGDGGGGCGGGVWCYPEDGIKTELCELEAEVLLGGREALGAGSVAPSGAAFQAFNFSYEYQS
jgi:hypothetical protein